MHPRKPHVILSIKQRQAIIGQLKSGIAVSNIAAIYNVNRETIRRIRQGALRLDALVDSNEGHEQIKIFKKPVYEDLENQLYTWFVEKRVVGVKITNALLLEKAAEFAKDMQIPTFRASRVWAKNCKKRLTVRLSMLHGKQESADKNAATKEECLRKCEEEGSRVADDEENETDQSQNRDDSNDSVIEINRDQEEAKQSGRTKQEFGELKYIHERLRHLCARDPQHIREFYEVLRRYHFGGYDDETTQGRERGHSSHQNM